MALSILTVKALDLTSEGVRVTGEVPTGLFSIGLPGADWSGATTALLAGAFSVIFVGYSESLASARMTSLKHGQPIDPDQELIAQGAACGAAGLVGGFATDGSLSKTSVADAAGQKTQMASLINADWVFFMGAMLGILFLGIIQGILIGVVLSLLALIARASKPGIRRLGLERESGSYQDVTTHEGLEMIPGVLVVRVDGPLFFADAARFRDTLNELIQGMGGPVRAVVLDADAISQTDTDGADIVSLVATELQTRGITLALARVQPSVLELWTRAGAVDALGPGRLFGTVRGAVNAVTATSTDTTS